MTHKNKLLEHLLIAPEVNQTIIFTSTKRHADVLAEDLYAAGHKTAALHGDMTQGARNRTLTKLRHGDVKVLVATDVAARGIDVAGISHVINYDLPIFAEDYVLRIGRTGRAGATGIAISFASNMDRHILRKIEQFTGQRMEPAVIEGFEPKRAIRMDAPGGRGDRRDGHKPGGRSGFKPRDDRGGYKGRDGGRSENRFESRTDNNRTENRGNRDSSPREVNGFGDRSAFDRNPGERRSSNSGKPNHSFGDSAAFGKKPYARDGQRNEGQARRDNNRNEGRSNASRGFANANAGSGAPRRPRNFA